jgi:hypothetical protein
MARPLVSDELWGLIEPLIPKVRRRHRLQPNLPQAPPAPGVILLGALSGA